MRKSNLFLSYLGIAIALFFLMFAHASWERNKAAPVLEDKREMVAKLELTDLCLFTEARYTRHPVMADLNTAFQDYPMSFEHYPTGSLVPPPAHMERKRQP